MKNCLILIKFTLATSTIFYFNTLQANQLQDTSKTKILETIEISEKYSIGGVEHYNHSKDQVIFAGKKNEILRPERKTADLSSNNIRQIYAKVPGLSIWESDASGIQTSIATRGLSPNRSWEFNIRQNGADICSDVFGYPEAYFTPPIEAVEQIEVIRGAASLQFGPQFGGLVNYRIKSAKDEKKWQAEVQQTIGSYGLYNSYNALGGDLGKFKWYGYYHQRSAETWRENNAYKIQTGYLSMEYKFNQKWTLSADYTSMNYTSQQPGGLTDQMFNQNHQQSIRSRNWMSTPWNTGSVNLIYKINDNSSIQWKTFLTHSFRNSVGFIRALPALDTISSQSLNYAERQLDKDEYNNIGSELRSLTTYQIFKKSHQLALGLRAYHGQTARLQLGKGTIFSDANFQATDENFGRDLKFGTQNFSVFAENIFQLHKRWKMIPGLRYEHIQNSIEGRINLVDSSVTDHSTRNILLAGIALEFKINDRVHMYANISKAYRPVTFSELTPSAVSDVIDPNLQDANGYNADLGIRGRVKQYLSFDFSVYHLRYNDRIGSLIKDGYVLRTNIGASESFGVESYFELNFTKLLFAETNSIPNIKIFSSNSLNNSKYISWNNPAIAEDPTKSIKGKKVEYAPEYVHRFGIQLEYKFIHCSFQSNFVSGIFTDAANTYQANTASTIGFIPSYAVHDATLAIELNQLLTLTCGVNNFTNAKYATRRSGGYPGPGLLPGQGRTMFLGIGYKI